MCSTKCFNNLLLTGPLYPEPTSYASHLGLTVVLAKPLADRLQQQQLYWLTMLIMHVHNLPGTIVIERHRRPSQLEPPAVVIQMQSNSYSICTTTMQYHAYV